MRLKDLKAISTTRKITIRGKSCNGVLHDYVFTLTYRPAVKAEMLAEPNKRNRTMGLMRIDKGAMNNYWVHWDEVMKGSGITVYHRGAGIGGGKRLVVEGKLMEGDFKPLGKQPIPKRLPKIDHEERCRRLRTCLADIIIKKHKAADMLHGAQLLARFDEEDEARKR